MFLSFGTHPSGIGTSGLRRFFGATTAAGLMMVTDGSGACGAGVGGHEVPGVGASYAGGHEVPGACGAGAMRYLLHPRLPAEMFVVSHPSLSNALIVDLTTRSHSPVLREIDAIDGQHSPSSLALSAKAISTKRFVAPCGPPSHIKDIILMLTGFAPLEQLDGVDTLPETFLYSLRQLFALLLGQ